jgi:DNA mismatch repair ATPase MutS
MMQAGMFVGATSFGADVRDGLFTHFRREEDEDLRRGKLDEELARMSWIVDHVAPGAMVLLNESFASTNEREGAEIARGIVHALLEAGVKVGYVTHMYELGHGLLEEGRDDALFLRAERLPDGRRTYRVIGGEPLPTSHGQDVYRRVFGAVS